MIAIQKNIALAKYTTFGIGGSARFFTVVTTTDELQEALQFAHEHDIPWCVLSGGSNMLIADAGYEGLVIHNKILGITFDEATIAVASGEVLLDVLRQSALQEWSGAEKLAGIPGTIGGAVRGNAGAFGAEIKDFIESVTVFNTVTGEAKEFEPQECGFGYRNSLFKQQPELFIISCVLKFTKGTSEESLKKIAETIAEREKRHLQNVACAGSYFMNPVAPMPVQALFFDDKQQVAKEGRVPAGWLIEKVGLKGFMIGGAQASVMHPNYVMNTGTATANDVRAVAQKIKETIKEKYLIQLSEEVTLVGF